MLNPSLASAPFFGGSGTNPVQAVWVEFPPGSPTGLSGPVIIFISRDRDIRFAQQCEEQLFLFGDTVYSAWRCWTLSPREILYGNISLLRAGRYWWPQLKWTGNFGDLPVGSLLNMQHRNSTPDDYNRQDPEYNEPENDPGFSVS